MSSSRGSKKEVLKTLTAELYAIKELSKALPAIEKAASLIAKSKGKLLTTGVGKSSFIAMKVAATLTSLGQSAVFIHPVDALHGDLGIVRDGDTIVAFSYSGESEEIIKVGQYLRKAFKVSVIAVTGKSLSRLGKLADVVISIAVKEEGSPLGLAPMASTTAMLVAGDMLASSLTSREVFAKEHFAKFHPGGALGLELAKVESLMKTGRSMPIVRESSSTKAVLKNMSLKKLGITAAVNREGRLLGVVTDGDIRRWLLAGGKPSLDTAKEIMTKNPKTIQAGRSLKEALRVMEVHHITALFVVDKTNRPKGVIHIHDIIGKNVV
ncbi:MAG: KpsF/GutQ family sugar-phosphate isomerase [bacterium]|nr:KpsF/GutQ family sugar-phosphate isomerase [bacterium]